jgi:hypothetical protein
MFQQFAVAYKIPGSAQEFGTTCVVDLEEAYQLGMEEMGDARRALLRRMIAIRHLGNLSRAHEVEITEAARLGEPTPTP